MAKNIFILFVVLAFTQCRKDPHIPFCELYPNECIEMHHIKDHYYFKTGSWWVYEEQNTGAIDSQWVSQSWSNDCDFELTVKNSQSGYVNNYWSKLLTNGNNCDVIKRYETAAFILQNKTKPGDYVGELSLSHFFYRENDSVYNYVPNISNNYSRLTKIHDEVEILDSSYNYVLEYIVGSNPLENFQTTKYLYSEHVGLIKKELIDSNQVWLLTKYNVEQ